MNVTFGTSGVNQRSKDFSTDNYGNRCFYQVSRTSSRRYAQVHLIHICTYVDKEHSQLIRNICILSPCNLITFLCKVCNYSQPVFKLLRCFRRRRVDIMIFCNDSGAIVSFISTLCPWGQTFLSERLKEIANAYSINENDLKHEIPLAKHLLRKELQLSHCSNNFFYL